MTPGRLKWLGDDGTRFVAQFDGREWLANAPDIAAALNDFFPADPRDRGAGAFALAATTLDATVTAAYRPAPRLQVDSVRRLPDYDD